MKTEITKPLRVTFVNPTFHRAESSFIMEPKNLTLTFVCQDQNSDNLADFEDAVDAVLNRLDSALVIRVTDPYMTKVLEPKTGNTVHTFLSNLKDKFTDVKYARGHIILGETTPPDTINGYTLFVLPGESALSLENFLRGLYYDVQDFYPWDEGKVRVQQDQYAIEFEINELP